MAESLSGQCPHCGQAIEYPAEGSGEKIACPTCEQFFVLKPVTEPASAVPRRRRPHQRPRQFGQPRSRYRLTHLDHPGDAREFHGPELLEKGLRITAPGRTAALVFKYTKL